MLLFHHPYCVFCATAVDAVSLAFVYCNAGKIKFLKLFFVFHVNFESLIPFFILI
jgi:hypothetical protein